MRMPHDRLDKVVLITACKLGQATDFAKHNLFQKVLSDVMGRRAGSTRTVIVGAIEVTNFVVALVEMEMQIASAISANQQSGEHILFSILTFALPGFAAFFLNLLPGSPIYNRLMGIFEHNHIFRVIRQTLFVFVRLTVGLEIDKITAIFLHCQDFDDCSGSPVRMIRIQRFA